MEREAILKGLTGVRRSVIRVTAPFAIASLVSYFLWEEILRFIQRPLGMPLVSYGIPEVFFTSIKVALISGIFFSSPFIFKELWASIAPSFTPESKRYAPSVVMSASLLFYAGAAISYFLLLPAGIKFLLGYETEHIKAAISIGSYISFFASMIFGFGLAFEMPLVMLLLGRAGTVNSFILSRYRRYAMLIIVTASAIITPTPDLFNLALMAFPLILLYELSIILVRVFGIKPS